MASFLEHLINGIISSEAHSFYDILTRHLFFHMSIMNTQESFVTTPPPTKTTYQAPRKAQNILFKA